MKRHSYIKMLSQYGYRFAPYCNKSNESRYVRWGIHVHDELIIKRHAHSKTTFKFMMHRTVTLEVRLQDLPDVVLDEIRYFKKVRSTVSEKLQKIFDEGASNEH